MTGFLVVCNEILFSCYRDACKKFLDLWKAKHESGQWVEVEATEAMSCRSDMPSTNAAGIVFLGSSESKESFPPGDMTPEKKGISSPSRTNDTKNE